MGLICPSPICGWVYRAPDGQFCPRCGTFMYQTVDDRGIAQRPLAFHGPSAIPPAYPYAAAQQPVFQDQPQPDAQAGLPDLEYDVDFLNEPWFGFPDLDQPHPQPQPDQPRGLPFRPSQTVPDAADVPYQSIEDQDALCQSLQQQSEYVDEQDDSSPSDIEEPYFGALAPGSPLPVPLPISNLQDGKKLRKKHRRKRKTPADMVWCFTCSRPGHVDGSDLCQQPKGSHKLADFGINLHWPGVSEQEIINISATSLDSTNIAGCMTRLMIYHQEILMPYEAFAEQRDGLIRSVLEKISMDNLLHVDHLTALKKLFGDANNTVIHFLRVLSNDMAILRTAIEQTAAEAMNDKNASRGKVANWILTGVGPALLSPKQESVGDFNDAVTRRMEAYGTAILTIRAQQVKVYQQLTNPSQVVSRCLLLPAQMMPMLKHWIVLNNKEYLPNEPLSQLKYPKLQDRVNQTGLFLNGQSQGGQSSGEEAMEM